MTQSPAIVGQQSPIHIPGTVGQQEPMRSLTVAAGGQGPTASPASATQSANGKLMPSISFNIIVSFLWKPRFTDELNFWILEQMDVSVTGDFEHEVPQQQYDNRRSKYRGTRAGRRRQAWKQAEYFRKRAIANNFAVLLDAMFKKNRE